jgi:hypothetical protein
MRVIEDVIRARWQPRIRERLRRQAEARGISVHTRARFGFASAAGSSDDPRRRLITQRLSGAVARELFAARDAGTPAPELRHAEMSWPAQPDIAPG